MLSQLSLDTGTKAWAAANAAASEHSTVLFKAFAAVVHVGAVTSWTLIVCDAVVELPQASVAVHVLVILYEPAHAPFVVTSADVNVKALPQASVAVATANTGVAGQLMVDVAGNAAITGAVISWTLIVCDAIVELPQASVAVHVLVIVYLFTQLPGVVTSATATVTVPVQLSVAVTEFVEATGTSAEQV